MDLDVIIISAYGRGVWLANELSRSKKKTAFVDVSRFFPYSNREDLEGPFGFFLSHKMDYFQQQWWKKKWTVCPQGFSILTDKIPIHFKEIFLSSVYEKYQDYQALRKYIKNEEKLTENDFQKNWLIYLCRQMMAGVDFEFNKKIPIKKPPLFEDFGILSHHEETDSLLFEDILFQEQTDCNILIPPRKGNFVLSNKNGKSLKSKYLVFMLSPLETYLLQASLFHLIFPKKHINPLWSWRRFSFEWEEYPIPLYLVLASPHAVPWTYERLICLKKSLVYKNQIHVWLRLPFLNEGPSHLVLVKKIIQQLESFFPQFKWRYLNNPLTHNFLFPIYSFQDVKKMTIISHPRFFYSFSVFDLSLSGQALREIKIFKKIQAMDSVF